MTGYLPYVTLGMGGPLRNAIGNDYRYGVYSRSDSSIMNDVALTAIQDRWEPTLASGLPPATALTAYGNLSQLDLCRALGVGRQSSVDTSYLNVAATLSNEHVAYVLVDPGSADLDGDGSLFDGLNSSGLTFEHPTTSASSDYDDEVKVVYFDEMWARMGCSGLLSPAGHAHPNVESTLALFRQSFRDYLAQLEITEEMGTSRYSRPDRRRGHGHRRSGIGQCADSHVHRLGAGDLWGHLARDRPVRGSGDGEYGGAGHGGGRSGGDDRERGNHFRPGG